MSTKTGHTETTSIRNNRIIRRAIIPQKYHHAAKLMAKSLNIPVGEIYDEAVESFLIAPSLDLNDYIRVGRKNNPPKVSFWLDIRVSNKAQTLAELLGITEHEVLLTAIIAYAKKHKFDRVRI
ncbi:hypothetical protein [Citrobacter freundii]|uniref:hypothetical protein n=1 Tax=Citrobacter freundii TaxID=546 RepID=UPI0011C0680F|nr:hypothetical protein [Citrobacter freundii]